jgi:acetyl coenzyme A synthetase (ADP forming)-like protein
LLPFFEPGTVAVIGAGRRRGRVGAEIFHNLASEEFRGRLVPVNPHAREIGGVTAYRSILDIPGSVDLAVIAVPATEVDAAVDDCLTKGVPALVVISAGFSETGEAGRLHEAALRDRVRAAGARMVGPNCLGMLNTDPAVRLNATFSPVFPPPGRVAFSSQSGAVALAALEYAGRLGLGLSSVVSVGNKADVSTNDLLEYWADDPRTDVILLYVESFGNPQRFSRIARRVSRVKPVVVVKPGRSRAGARAAASHTGALAATDKVVDTLFRDAGVIRAYTLEELFDVARLLAHQPTPAGARVAILTNAGGPAILAADACETSGLTLPELSPATMASMRSFLPSAACVTNPVDMLATASADDYRRALRLLLDDPLVDSVLTIFVSAMVTQAADVARVLTEIAQDASKPLLATLLGQAGSCLDGSGRRQVPCYEFPEAAALALARVVRRAEWQRQPVGTVPALNRFDRAAMRAVLTGSAPSPDGWLPTLDAYALLDAAGIPHAPTVVVRDEAAAVDAARTLGYPVVLKGCGPNIVHKTEAHAVRLRLSHETAVREAYQALSALKPEGVDQIVMQPQLSGGVEFLAGAVLDPTFGHVIVCGSGGTMLELVDDTACRLQPLTDVTARDMIDSLRGALLLRGYRGAPPGDESALADILLRVSALVEACPEVTDLDLNPVIVMPSGARAVDVRVRVRGRGSAAL